MSRIGLRTKLIVSGVLVAIIVGVVASASAEPPPPTACKAGGTPSYCVEGVALVSASEKITGTNSSASILKAMVANVAAEIKCASGKSTGSIEGGTAGTAGKSKIRDTFEGCKLLKPANCKLTAEDETDMETAELLGGLTLGGSRIENKWESKSGGSFASIGIEGENPSCVIAGVGTPETFAITGSQLCEIDSSNTAAETEAASHKIVCKTTGSSLKLGSSKAEMTSEATIKLTSGKNWSIKET